MAVYLKFFGLSISPIIKRAYHDKIFSHSGFGLLAFGLLVFGFLDPKNVVLI